MTADDAVRAYIKAKRDYELQQALTRRLTADAEAARRRSNELEGQLREAEQAVLRAIEAEAAEVRA